MEETDTETPEEGDQEKTDEDEVTDDASKTKDKPVKKGKTEEDEVDED